MHEHVYAYMCTCTYAHLHVCAHTHMPCAHAYMPCAHSHMPCAHTPMLTCTYAHTHICAHARMRTHMPDIRLCQTVRQQDTFPCSPSLNFKILLAKILIKIYYHLFGTTETEADFCTVSTYLKSQRFQLYKIYASYSKATN